ARVGGELTGRTRPGGARLHTGRGAGVRPPPGIDWVGAADEGPPMPKRTEGNGEPKVEILTTEKKPGYLIIYPKSLDYLPDRLPVFLSLSLERWVLEHPQFRVRATAGFVQEGKTVALHVWYDICSRRPWEKKRPRATTPGPSFPRYRPPPRGPSGGRTNPPSAAPRIEHPVHDLPARDIAEVVSRAVAILTRRGQDLLADGLDECLRRA